MYKMNLKIFFLIMSLVFAFFMFTGVVSAANWTVNPGDSIQAAVNNAAVNDTIVVNDNGSSYTYTENLNVNKTITLQANSSNVNIQGQNLSIPTLSINSLGNGTTIQGFTFINSTNAGILIDGATDCTITGNNFINNTNGIILLNSSSNTISGNNIQNNTNMGISIFNSSNSNIIDSNTISNNGIIGVFIQNSNTNTISNNTIQNNGWVGICLDNSSSNTINSGNNISGNVEGVYIVSNANGNTITGNNIHNNSDAGISILNGSNGNIITVNNAISTNTVIGVLIRDSNTNTITGNTIQNNGWAGLALDNADGNTINGTNIISGNDEGISIANNSDGNNVNGNNITGNTNVGVSVITNSTGNFITNNIAISGNENIGVYFRDSNNNTVSGNKVQFNSWAGICLDHAMGNMINSNNELSGNQEGIFLANNSTGNTIEGNNIHNNNGAGINILASSNNNLVTNSVISNNGVMGVIIQNSNSNTIFSNIIQNNTWSGIVLDHASSNIIQYNNKITGNQEGIYIANNSKGNTIQNNIINNNAGSGINILSSSNENTINFNSQINDNGVSGIFIQNSNGTIIHNNTIQSNNWTGIVLDATNNNKITTNIIENNSYGIYLNNSSANLNFNCLNDNYYYEVYNVGNGIIDAINNWWGNNNQVNMVNGGINYIPWLILNITATPDNIGENNSTIIADLTRNSNNDDTSPQGFIPDNLQLNLTTNLGNITTTIYTNNGKATAVFNRGTSTSGIANINVTLDGQSIQTNITIDTTPPNVTANPNGGTYTTTQTVTLTATDNYDQQPTIYYTTDGTNPTTSSIIYSTPINIINQGTTILKFIAADSAGNQSSIQTQNYTLNLPLNINDVELASQAVINYITSNNHVPSYVNVFGKYSTTPSFLNTLTSFTLKLNNNDTTPVSIVNVNAASNPSGSASGTLQLSEYITLANNIKTFISNNGRAPNYASSSLGNIRYESLICLYSNILNYYRINNQLPGSITVSNIVGVSSSGVTINMVTNIDTGKTYTSIQDAINDPLTLNGNTIELNSGTYTENVTVNKTLIIKPVPDGSAIIQTLNSSNPIFTLNCNGTIIQGLTITLNGNSDGIYLNQSSDNTIQNNIISYNGGYGIHLSNSSNNTIQNNTIISNGNSGIYSFGSLNNIIQNNTITNNNGSGIHIYMDPSNGIAFYGGYNNGIINIGSGSNGSVLNTAVIDNPTDNKSALLELIGNSLLNNAIQNNIITNNNGNGIKLENTSNNLIQNNNSQNNNESGIYISYSSKNIIHNNILMNNVENGIYLHSVSTNNLVQNNTVSYNNASGIVLYSGSTGYYLIQFNIITNNQIDGINVSGYTSADINFNRITDNGRCGFYGYETGVVHALNNWWGSNNPVFSSVYGSDIYYNVGYDPVYYNLWLVLNVSSHTPSADNSDYTVSADLTHNNQGNDTSPQGSIPDGTPVNFVTTFGTIETTVYTCKGKAVSPLSSDINGVANVTATLDDQTNFISVILGAYNETTQISYTSIQAAINAASSGDVIGIYNGTYNENIIINKSIKIVSGGGSNPTINGSITINSDDTNIQGLIINGHINLFANNCIIFGNNIIGNGTSGIITSNSTNNTITHNNITSNGFNGIQSIESSVIIYHNTIHDCVNAIYSENSNNTIRSNSIINNSCGIYTNNSTDTIQFNRITGNNYGLKNEIGTVNATNNWWGSNNPIISSTSPSDIYIISGNVDHDIWLILNVDISSTNSGGNTYVTADLTHNNLGVDTSTQDFIPDGTPINFTTNNGSIINQAYTVKGQTKTILNLNSTQPQNVTTSASLDQQSISTTGNISTGIAVLNLTSTAIDNSTGQPLNITYNIPLNESVTWLSILWTPTTIPGISNPSEEIQIIINGNVVLNRYIYNISGQNRDDLAFNLTYPGVTGFNINVTDPNNQTTNLNFPGNVIIRTSKISYTGSPYDGVKSFAIATKKVTSEIFNYWLDQKSLYNSPNGMSDAYTAFLTALMLEYYHDYIADEYASEYNVTWSRTSPIIVSANDDAYETYLTLECDHTMGMTVVSTPDNMFVFNYFTSLYISLTECMIMKDLYNVSYQSSSSNREFTSVAMDLLKYNSFNSALIESFIQNDYLIIKTVNNYDFMIVDLDTGVVRDINIINNFCGAYDIRAIFGFSVTGTPICGYPTIWGNPWTFGPLTFHWDGFGRILIASDYAINPDTDQIWTMGKLTVIGTLGTLSFNQSNPENTPVYGPDLDVTGILIPGMDNIISLTLDASGDYIGCSPLWLIQVIDLDYKDRLPPFPDTPLNPDDPHSPFNPDNLLDLLKIIVFDTDNPVKAVPPNNSTNISGWFDWFKNDLYNNYNEIFGLDKFGHPL